MQIALLGRVDHVSLAGRPNAVWQIGSCTMPSQTIQKHTLPSRKTLSHAWCFCIDTRS